MKKLKAYLLENIIFWIIIVFVLLLAFVNEFMECIGDNPFASEYLLENPVQSIFADDYHYYVTNSSYMIAVTDNRNRLIYVIEGGNPGDTFDYADAIATGNDGTLYVHDKSYQNDGFYAYRERIIKFTDNGKKREILYEVQTTDENNKQIKYLDSPKIIDDKLYFSEISINSICVKSCFNGAAEECAIMSLDGANNIVAESTFSNDLEISVVLMNGDIYTCHNGTNEILYDARKHDTEDYCSLITEIAYRNDGVLYANDIGQRRLLSIDKNKTVAAVEKGGFANNESNEIALCPIYTGMNVYDNTISTLSAEYKYDSEIGAPIYFYHIAVEDINGNKIFYGNSIGISAERRIVILCVYIAIFLILLISIYYVIRIIRIIRRVGIIQAKTQLLVLVTAIAVTFGVSISIFHSSNDRFTDESAANLSNIAYLIDSTIDKDIVKSIDTPDMYFKETYEVLNESIVDILRNEVNKNRNVYTVIYKVYNNVICEVYRNDFYHGIMYPMAGAYSGSIEEDIAENKICYISQDYELSEGSYTFALIPSCDERGEVVAFIEVGTDYNFFVQENNRLFKKLLLTASMVVIIIMLLFAEMMNGIAAFRSRKLALSEKKQNPPEVIRPIAFLIFFTANITTAFLPIYGTSLWNKSFPLPGEVAAAFPLSAELAFSALSAFLCGFLIKKTGIRFMCIIGAIFYICGNILSAFAGNLWVLICANSVCGIGGGLLTIAVNTWITGFSSEEYQNKGFAHYNAAFLAGMNCGTVIGSLIWESFGFTAAYITAAVCAALILIVTLLFIEKRKVTIKEEPKEKKLSLKVFISPGMLRYFVCLAIPYLICASFLSYYFPIVAERSLLSAAEISMAFLISGVISIYSGSIIGEIMANHFGTRKTMILASFIYAIALFYLVINPSIFSCYVVIVLFAVADSFGLSAQSVYFTSMTEVKKVGQSRALGINSTIESIASAFGSVIFGSALLLGEQRGILMIGTIFAILLILFIIGGRKNAKFDKSESR